MRVFVSWISRGSSSLLIGAYVLVSLVSELSLSFGHVLGLVPEHCLAPFVCCGDEKNLVFNEFLPCCVVRSTPGFGGASNCRFTTHFPFETFERLKPPEDVWGVSS